MCIRSERDFEQKSCFWALSAARGPIWALFRGGALFSQLLGGDGGDRPCHGGITEIFDFLASISSGLVYAL